MATRYKWTQEEVEKFQENWNQDGQTYEGLAILYNGHDAFVKVRDNQSKLITKLNQRYESLLIGGADLQVLPPKERATSNGTIDFDALNKKAHENLSKDQIKKISQKRAELIKKKDERNA